MVRTRADNTARKAVAAKAPRKNYNAAAGPSATSPTSAAKANKNAGGNPYCPRPTPDWQKEITNFFIKTPRADKENEDPEDEASAAGGRSNMVTENTEDVPTSSKTADKRKIKKSKDTSPDQSEAATSSKDTSVDQSEAATSSKDTSVDQSEAATSSKDALEDKMDDDEAVAPAASKQQDSEPMEVEIKIVDKKEDKNAEPEKDKESPRPFQKNNCISDSDEDD